VFNARAYFSDVAHFVIFTRAGGKPAGRTSSRPSVSIQTIVVHEFSSGFVLMRYLAKNRLRQEFVIMSTHQRNKMRLDKPLSTSYLGRSTRVTTTRVSFVCCSGGVGSEEAVCYSLWSQSAGKREFALRLVYQVPGASANLPTQGDGVNQTAINRQQ